MRRLLLLALLPVLSACALRPRYADFVPAVTAPGAAPATATARPEGSEVALVLREKASGRALPGVTVELGEGKNRHVATTGADGAFTVPVAKRLRDDNAVLVVRLPAGVAGYRLEVAPPPKSPEPPPEEPPPEESAPAEPPPAEPPPATPAAP